MKLLYKLLSGYFILALLALITDYVSVRSYQDIENKYNRVSTRSLPHIQALERVKAATLRIVASTSEYSLLVTEHESQFSLEPPTQEAVASRSNELAPPLKKSAHKAREDEEEELVQAGKKAFYRSLDEYETLIIKGVQTEQEAELAKKIRSCSQALLGNSTKLIALKKSGISGEEIKEAKEGFEESERATLAVIEAALEHEYSSLKNSETEVRSVIARATRMTTIIDLIAVALAIVVGGFVAQSVSRRVGKLKDATQKISAGNLDEHIAINESDEIGDLARAFNAMTDALKRSGQEVLSAKNFADNIIESMTDLLVVADATATVQRANSAASNLLGFDRSEVIGQPVSGICADPQFLSALDLPNLSAQSSTLNFEKCCLTKDGKTIPMSISVAALKDYSGQPQGLVFVGRDISESKQAKEKIQASLVEKEVLLKEIHHRVKNNLQIISSLLNMQARKITDEHSRAIFLDSMNRVKSMALIHESLYQSSDLSQIDFDEYLHKLASHILRSYNLDTERIRLTFSSTKLQMSVDAAVPCGLIINELVSNSLKYAFPDERKGEIHIELQLEAPDYKLICADNGVGLPSNFDISQATSLGLKIVRTLTDQLNGDLHIHTTNGTTFEIIFPQ